MLLKRNEYATAVLRLCLDYLFSFSIIVGSLSVYVKSDFRKYVLALISVLTLMLFIQSSYKIIKKKETKVMLYGLFYTSVNILCFCVLYIFQGASFEGAYKFILVCIFFPIWFIILASRRENIALFLSRFVRCFSILSLVGLILWFLYTLNLVNTNVSLSLSWGNYSEKQGIFGLFFCAQGVDEIWWGIPITCRFTSIFIEAPVYSGTLLLVLAVSLYWTKTNIFDIIVLILSGICSISTTFIILAPIIFLPVILHYFSSHKLEKNILIKRTLLVSLVIIILIAYQLIANEELQSKLSVNSGQSHLADFSSGIEAFFNSPIIGNGVSNHDEAWRAYSARGVASQSSSLMATLSEGGIILMIPYLYPVLTHMSTCIRKKILLIVPDFVLIAVFTVCILDESMVVYLFMSLCCVMQIDIMFTNEEKRITL